MEPTYGATGGHSHAPHGRCSGGHGIGPGRAVISGDLVQSRDFHYSVEPAPVYRRPREVAYHTQAQVEHKYLEWQNSVHDNLTRSPQIAS